MRVHSAHTYTPQIDAVLTGADLPCLPVGSDTVWNEPNCCPSFFWTDGQAGYFELFNWTARAVKAVDPLIPVGGPTTAYVIA